MSEQRWIEVDRYITDLLVGPDAALDGALTDSAAAGLPSIQVSPNQGKLLHLLAKSIGARKILEIGTLGGYSAIWLARALPPDGRLITIESDSKTAEVARRNLERAGLENVVQVRKGLALEVLPKIEAAGLGPFDLIFIDADKPSNADYFQWALKLSHVGSWIVVDNVVQKGEVVNSDSVNPNILGVRQCNDLLASEKRVSATILQTVGSKGYDGFALALVVA